MTTEPHTLAAPSRRALLGHAAGLAVAAWAPPLRGAEAPTLPTADADRLAGMVHDALKSKNVPGAAVALVIDGRIAHVKAYGLAQVAPARPATPAMRWAIGSISKQFLAVALLMLEAEGRVALDEPVRRHLPDLGPAGEATLRQLLSHTAGLRDYYPQDYFLPMMREPVERAALLERWARRPLDFRPGDAWQYSNTGYAVAGAVLEKASGQPLFEFLKARVFVPLGMRSVIDIDRGPFGPDDASGHTAPALGAPVAAPREAPGWLFGAAELAMTPEDLARWNVAMIEQRLLAPAGWRSFATDTRLNDGSGTRYGLGVQVRTVSEQRLLKHDGAVSGFIARNTVLPGQRAALTVLTNSDAADAASAVADPLENWLVHDWLPADRAATARDRAILEGLRRGELDRNRFTDNGNANLGAAALASLAQALRAAGALKVFELTWRSTRGGMDARYYHAELAERSLAVATRTWPDGRMEQFLVGPE